MFSDYRKNKNTKHYLHSGEEQTSTKSSSKNDNVVLHLNTCLHACIKLLLQVVYNIHINYSSDGWLRNDKIHAT